jgi:glucosamine--fructose-6-phosphate aminotransferase (isomerizing)
MNPPPPARLLAAPAPLGKRSFRNAISMCGIVGYIGSEDAVSVLTPALKRLEYRGYDSAGIATLNGHGLRVCKTIGKIAALEQAIAAVGPGDLDARLGIAHTRWATHGRPTDVNAHPHLDCRGRLAVVHNGIVENHRELRQTLTAEGHRFRSQTDTEVIAHLIERHLRCGLLEALRRAAAELRGSFALACIAEEAPDMIVAMRRGSSPLVIGRARGASYLASDLPALVGRTGEATVVDEGEIAILTADGVRLQRPDGAEVRRLPIPIPRDAALAEKGAYAHFMLKEIHEQPDVVARTLADRLDPATGGVDLDDAGLDDGVYRRATRVRFVACGTSLHAGLVGKYLVEELAGVAADVEIASELRHRPLVREPGALVVPISQSGETADTLAALRHLRAVGAPTLGICNVMGSAVARETDGVLYTRAGIEIGVAATKSFTAQVAAVTLLALRLAQARAGLAGDRRRAIAGALLGASRLMRPLLDQSDRIRLVASRLAKHASCLYLGRGLQYPLALEGALKLKEVSYVHAEGYAAGEMKHGPIALIDRRMPVVALAPAGPTQASMLGNIQEVKARDGIVIALAAAADEAVAAVADVVIDVPPADPIVQPLLLALPLQLLAYHLAVMRGCDVDQPRNLAKSVTVD